jgi:hypothetical protein
MIVLRIYRNSKIDHHESKQKRYTSLHANRSFSLVNGIGWWLLVEVLVATDDLQIQAGCHLNSSLLFSHVWVGLGETEMYLCLLRRSIDVNHNCQ